MMANLYDAMEDILSKLPLNPVILIAKSTATELKSRLIGAKAGLTIVDLRHPETFNQEHLIGAISVPFNRVGDLAQSCLPRYCEIYVYGESDSQSLRAVKILLGNGFKNVAQLIGGLSAWQEISGATEDTPLDRRH